MIQWEKAPCLDAHLGAYLNNYLIDRIGILIPWIDSIASGTAGELLFLDVLSPFSYEGKALFWLSNRRKRNSFFS